MNKGTIKFKRRSRVSSMKWFDYYFDQFKCILDISITILLGLSVVGFFVYTIIILMVNSI